MKNFVFSLTILLISFGHCNSVFAADTVSGVYQVIFANDSLKVWLDRKTLPPNYVDDRFGCRAKGYVEFTVGVGGLTKEDLRSHLAMILMAKSQGKVMGFDHTVVTGDSCKAAVWSAILN